MHIIISEHLGSIRTGRNNFPGLQNKATIDCVFAVNFLINVIFQMQMTYAKLERLVHKISFVYRKYDKDAFLSFVTQH